MVRFHTGSYSLEVTLRDKMYKLQNETHAPSWPGPIVSSDLTHFYGNINSWEQEDRRRANSEKTSRTSKLGIGVTFSVIQAKELRIYSLWAARVQNPCDPQKTQCTRIFWQLDIRHISQEAVAFFYARESYREMSFETEKCNPCARMSHHAFAVFSWDAN